MQIVTTPEHDMAPQQAVHDAVAFRLRPIAMTTLTTAFGSVPLDLTLGEGTELYRGQGVLVMFGLVGFLFALPGLKSTIMLVGS